MLSTEKLLDILAERDLLPEKLLVNLRRQVTNSAKPIRPEAVAKRLIDAGHLTPALAKRLLAALPDEEAKLGEAGGGRGLSDSPREKTAPVPKEAWDEDDLGLAPLEDEPRLSAASKASKARAKRSSDSAQPPRTDSPPAGPKQPEQPPSNSLLEEELASLESTGGALGPLDGLLDAGGMDTAAAGSPLLLPATRRRGLFAWLKRGRRAPQPARRENVWESPQLLLSGGALLALLIVGAVLLWTLGRQSGDDVLAAANEEYRAGSYTQAIHKFDQYLRRFPNHPGASSARVTRGLARLRQKTSEGADGAAALAMAQQVLEEITSEEAFGQSAGELAAILPAITEDLAARAQETNDPELLAHARKALELAANRMIVPKRLQPTAKLEELEARLALVDRQIQQGAELEATVLAIEKALSQGGTERAYEARRELLRGYPALAGDPKLIDATRAISVAQQSAVEVDDEVIQPGTDLPATSVLATFTLAERNTKEPLPDADGEVFVAIAAGAAYGFNAADGRLLWQRELGESPDGLRAALPPLPAAGAAGSDVFVVAPRHEELWRLDAHTGHPRWRLPLGEPVDVSPVLAGGQIVVATRGGRLHLVDAETGTSARRIQLPQPVPVAPAVDTRRGMIFQAADHSNLFVLELGTGRCLDVIYAGHAPGSLSAAPALVAGVLLVPVNDRARTGSLRVYGAVGNEDVAPPENGVEPFRPGLFRELQEFRVRGQFDTPPVVSGRNVAIVTDLGAAYVFELSAAETDKPLVPMLQREATDEEAMVRYGLFQGDRLFLADNRLTRFDIRTAEGRFVPQWISDEQSAFLQAPRAIGPGVVHVRRRMGEPGVIVAAVHAEDGRTLWQNRIAVPPADQPVLDTQGQRLVVASSTGALFQIDIASLHDDAVLDEPAIGTEQFRQAVTALIDLGDGAVLVSAGAGSDQLALFDPRESSERYIWRFLPGKLTCRPLRFQGGVLAPCLPGHLFFLDPRADKMLAEPFQPALTPGTRLDWRLPALGEGTQFAIADGRGRLFSVEVKPDPKPHLKSTATVELARPSVAPLAVTGKMVFAVDQASEVAAYELPDLKRRGEWPLQGACAWGPARVGDHVLVATEGGALLCFDAAAKLCWQVALSDFPLVGASVLSNGHFLTASAGGTLQRLSADDGSTSAQVDVGRLLGTAPIPMGPEVLVGGREGSLYRVKTPLAADEGPPDGAPPTDLEAQARAVPAMETGPSPRSTRLQVP